MKGNTNYVEPAVADLGSLVELTMATGVAGVEDGTGKTIQADVPGVGSVSVGVLP